MISYACFKNILAISWQSVLLAEESGVPEKTTYLRQVTNRLFYLKTN